MQNRGFDELPPEVKLHIFSFLSIRDTMSVLHVSRANHQLNSDDQFWRYKIIQDFYVTSPDGQQAKSYYFARLQALHDERRLFAAYLGACREVIPATLERQEKVGKLAAVDNALEHLPPDGFCNFSHQNVDDINSVANQIFCALVMNKKISTKNICSDALREIHYPVFNDVSEAYISSVGFALVSLAKCNAIISIKIIFGNISSAQRKQILNKFGANMLCCAALNAHVQVVGYLLALGVGANQYSFLLKDEHTLGALPIFYIYKLLVKAHRIALKGDAIKQVIELLINHGADMDLPAVKSIDQYADNQELPPSHRSQIILHLETMRKPYAALKDLLMLMINAPSYSQQECVDHRPVLR
jgi:hypothetical protein